MKKKTTSTLTKRSFKKHKQVAQSVAVETVEALAAADDAPVPFSPRVYADRSYRCTIVVHREDNDFFHIPMDDKSRVVRSDIIQFRRKYLTATEYPVGLAAFRFLNPAYAEVIQPGSTVRAILEILMKTYLVNVKNGKFVGSFADVEAAAAAAGNKKGLVAIDSEKRLAELPAKDLSAISVLIGKKVKVTEDDKAAAAKKIWAALKTMKNEPQGTNGREKNPNSKMEQAYAIFAKQYGKSSRSEIVKAFRDEVKLTEGGAPTYYYLCVKRMTEEYKKAGKAMPDGVKSERAPREKKAASKGAQKLKKAGIKASAAKGEKKAAAKKAKGKSNGKSNGKAASKSSKGNGTEATSAPPNGSGDDDTSSTPAS